MPPRADAPPARRSDASERRIARLVLVGCLGVGVAARPAPVAAGTTPSAAIDSTEVPVSSPIVDLAVDGPPVPAPDVASSTVAVAQQAPVPAGRTQGRSGPGAATVRLPATGIGTTTTAALAVITTLLGTFTRRATRRRVPVAPRS